MSIFEKHPTVALAVGALCLASITASGLAALQLSGMPMVLPREPAQAVAEAASPVAISAVLADSPASTSLTALLDEPPATWKPDGPIQQGVALPVPYSCDVGAAPSVALARSFKVGKVRVQVVSAAYTAGLGAEAMDDLLDNASDCAGSSVDVDGEDLDTPGVQAHRDYTNKSGRSMQVVTFRRGDVLTFVVGKADVKLRKLAKQLDKNLAGTLDGVCADQQSNAGDAARSPWSTDDYKPFTRTSTVAIRTVSPPQTPAGDGERAVPMPAPTLKVKAAKPAAEPSYPVWPLMPEARKAPKPPKSPADEPATSAKVRVLADDPAGPGCGWSFTGMAPVPFDAEDAALANRERTSAAEEKLAGGVEKWQQSVLDYWAAYDQYRTEVKEYKDYATAVAKVNKAWDKIAAQWDDYWRDYAVYQQALAERSTFFARRDNAQANYRDALAQCQADNREAEQDYRQAERDYQDAVDEAEDEDEDPPEPPAKPAQADCDAAIQPPNILNWAAPAEPTAPATPADPRPKDQR
ncbi:hypothetical protein [Arthrobacter sp. NPDC089319]|uniref:hypothetical protein n=1 Tax=Arthrobacter sp. NPDC089319 TaxID=3155915 RepID=UPI0034392A94